MSRRTPRRWSLSAIVALLGAPLTWGQATADMVNTKHNLSVSGTGAVRALSETRICVFCHTPHNSQPQSPLWNKALEPQVYTVYSSQTLLAGPLSQPSGPTKLCLSCHDGTIAMGAVISPAGGIGMLGTGLLPPGSPSDFGLNLSAHHPVSFPYQDALPDPELVATPPADLVFGGTDELHCTTCHDPHNDQYGRFLAKDNKYSALCTSCHQMNGWAVSAHAYSTAPVAGVLPRPPKTWPNYAQLGEWGCEACHAPHFAPTAEQLLNFTEGPPAFSCTSAGCHGSEPGDIHGVQPGASLSGRAATTGRAGVDIARQARKLSAHRAAAVPLPAAPAANPGAGRSGILAVSCSDCHNPHRVNGRPAQAPRASGLLEGVSGVDRNGAPVSAVRFEYEVCFKCHGNDTPDIDLVPRVVASTNLRLAFDTSNPSFHPVVDIARAPDVPSIPSSLEPAMRATQTIYCSSCHADDEGLSRGPHGSAFAPILRERYETADLTLESYENYALCYRCHERTSILRDVSFRKKTRRTTPSGGGHSGHLARGAACSVCHDPHGVPLGGAAGTGSHTHLINFDSRVVLPKAGNPYPVFSDSGTFAGSCTLVCHGVSHDAAGYP